MPINPPPPLQVPFAVPDQYANASFFDVMLGQTVAALIASGNFAPGPLIMELALAVTSQLMVKTERWDGIPVQMSPDQAQQRFTRWAGVPK